MKPSIGRIVHYKIPGSTAGQFGECPAIVTAVWSDTCVNLHLLRDCDQSGLRLAQGNYPTSVVYDESKNDRTWHWPEREELPPGLMPVTAAELADVKEQVAELEQKLALLIAPPASVPTPPPGA